MTLMDSHLLLGMIEIEVHICAQWFKSVVFEPLKVFSVYHGNVGIFFWGGGGAMVYTLLNSPIQIAYKRLFLLIIIVAYVVVESAAIIVAVHFVFDCLSWPTVEFLSYCRCFLCLQCKSKTLLLSLKRRSILSVLLFLRFSHLPLFF